MFVWVTESNTVFQNLNLVLNDMNTLAKQSYAFKGSPTVRLILLLRTFFYELFRLREIFTVFLKDLKDQNILSKAEVHELKREVGQHFDRTTKIRNRMVHEYFHWPSRNITEMHIVEGLKHFDKVWVKKDLNEIYTLEGKIRDVYNEMVPVLTVEGHYIYEYLKKFGNTFAASLKDISSRYKT